ncbi:MAG: NAD(P)/FAD-dependent oxidoreductase [Euryarchaeota archaeon]|nr:NAD(P)/FAD-dependent oxidoreductase [Euryarchaeota archaeon]MBU4607129.1 NAD(P)/FAD-dependent oxidoreductase [Euryarchaeota archaeon]MBV1729434.1 NAD(P)/FAD-dependent oxidoreductase [Methanobacterium sp.]MBV1754107.1 NAD(P)/FAD-dependent oxidoreductase [Methanobacterium sp.]
MDDLPEKGAKLQVDGTYAIIPHVPGGLITSGELSHLAQVALKYNARLKITSQQRIALIGIKKEDIDKVWEDLGMKVGGLNGSCVKAAKFCPGNAYCKKGERDTLGIGMDINEKFLGIPTPNKMKIGISGCLNSCANSSLRDIGLIGTRKGWKIMVGGCGGRKPRVGSLLIKDLNDEEALSLVQQVIDYYKTQDTHKRLGLLIEKEGWLGFIKALY